MHEPLPGDAPSSLVAPRGRALVNCLATGSDAAAFLVLDATRTDPNTADAPLRHQAELGVGFIRGEGSAAPWRSGRAA